VSYSDNQQAKSSGVEEESFNKEHSQDDPMINKNNLQQQAKDTGLAFVLICLVVYLFSDQRAWVIVGIFCLLLCMICPRAYQPAARVWFGLSHFLGGIVSTIILTIIFYVVITPIGLLRQRSGADAMNLKKRGSKDSAFTLRYEIQGGKAWNF
jgi:hypothetical protein